MSKVMITWETADWHDDEDEGYIEWTSQSEEYDAADVALVIEALRFEGCNRNIDYSYNSDII